jgi:hypothetical protein
LVSLFIQRFTAAAGTPYPAAAAAAATAECQQQTGTSVSRLTPTTRVDAL